MKRRVTSAILVLSIVIQVRDTFCWNSGSCCAYDLACIFVFIGGFDPRNRLAIRLGHVSIQVRGIILFVTSVR
jgi:hypothetical protein